MIDRPSINYDIDLCKRGLEVCAHGTISHVSGRLAMIFAAAASDGDFDDSHAAHAKLLWDRLEHLRSDIQALLRDRRYWQDVRQTVEGIEELAAD